MRRGVGAAVIIGALVACRSIVGFDDLSKVDSAASGTGADGGGSAAEAVLIGIKHSCAIMVDQTLLCWGLNDFGQLGTGDTETKLTPTPVRGISDIAFVSLGERHTCATTADGAAFCWGSNESGQLGIGPPDTEPHPVPTRIESAAPAKKIQAGKSHSCTETITKTVECWGANQNGQLGDGTTTPKSLPIRVPGVTGVEKLSTGGGDHTCAVARNDGGADAVFCWGLNDKGQLGQPLTTKSSPVALEVPGLTGVDKVFIGREHSCATQDTTLQCWGANDRGQLGDGKLDTRHTPAPVIGVIGMTEIGAGYGHTCGAEKSAGVAKCWGSDEFGQIGVGGGDIKPTPTRVNLDGWEAATAKGNHSCGKRNGVIHCWGRNDEGQLGIGSRVDTNVPTPVKF